MKKPESDKFFTHFEDVLSQRYPLFVLVDIKPRENI